MRRIVLISLAAFLATELAVAQREPMVPMAAVNEKGKLTGKTKVLYLLRQIDLSKQQREHARGLIATIIDTGAEREFSLEQVYTLMAEMQEAEAAGDDQRKKEISQQLRELGQKTDDHEEFFMNMESVLSDAQKAKLALARARVERNPSGALRPVDIFRAVQELDLNDEQNQQVEELRARLRKSLRKTQALKDKQRFQVMNGLLEAILSKLTPEQQKQFGLSVAKLRPDLAYRLRVLTGEKEQNFQQKKAQAEAGAKTETNDE